MAELTNPRDYPLKGLKKIRFRFEYQRGSKAQERQIRKMYENTYGNEDLSYRGYLRVVDGEFGNRGRRDYRLFENELWDHLCRGVYFERITEQSIFHWLKGYQAAQARGALGTYPASGREPLGAIPSNRLVRSYAWFADNWNWRIFLIGIVFEILLDEYLGHPIRSAVSSLLERLVG